MKCITTLIFILLPLLSSSALAEAYRCTDAQGKVAYTNTECQAGNDVKSIKDQTNLIDYSKERQFVERELARARAKADSGFSKLEPIGLSLLILFPALLIGIWAWRRRKN